MENDIVEVRINKWTGLYTIIYENKKFEQTLYPKNIVEINKFLETATGHTAGLNLIYRKETD